MNIRVYIPAGIHDKDAFGQNLPTSSLFPAAINDVLSIKNAPSVDGDSALGAFSPHFVVV